MLHPSWIPVLLEHPYISIERDFPIFGPLLNEHQACLDPFLLGAIPDGIIEGANGDAFDPGGPPGPQYMIALGCIFCQIPTKARIEFRLMLTGALVDGFVAEVVRSVCGSVVVSIDIHAMPRHLEDGRPGWGRLVGVRVV